MHHVAVDILYLANARFPTEKAHGLQIMKMCEALARAGAAVELVVPERWNPIVTDPFEFYGTERNFTITKLPSLDLVSWGRIGFWISSFAFAIAALRYTRKGRRVIYTRDEMCAYLVGFRRRTLAFEMHEGRWNIFMRRVAKRSDLIVTITEGLRAFLIQNGIPAGKIMVLSDAVDYDLFAHPRACSMRDLLGLPEDAPLVLYTGQLYDWKGAGALAQAAALVPEAAVVLVGGSDKDVHRLREKYGSTANLHILGQRSYRDIPGFLADADVLVIPNSGKLDLSRFYTSPMKLFEYMASGKPIVASDIPSLREILDESCAYFAKPDNPEDLARVVRRALSDPSAAARGNAAQEKARSYSWDARANSLLEKLRA